MDKLDTISDRIKYAIKHEGHTVATFARKCGVADSTIRSALLPGKKPGYDLIVTIIQAINQPWCDANWLIFGEEPTSKGDTPETKKLLKIIEDQQKTINDLQKQNTKLTDRLLAGSK